MVSARERHSFFTQFAARLRPCGVVAVWPRIGDCVSSQAPGRGVFVGPQAMTQSLTRLVSKPQLALSASLRSS